MTFRCLELRREDSYTDRFKNPQCFNVIFKETPGCIWGVSVIARNRFQYIISILA